MQEYDLISKQDVLEELACDLAMVNEQILILQKEVDDVYDRIRDLPAAQSERKRGTWVPVDAFSAFGGDEATWMTHGNPIVDYYCSECKEQAYAGEDGESLLTKFCPNCGCRMDLPSGQSERKKGKWVPDVSCYDKEGCPCVVTRCNQCGNVYPKYNFCPGCGADMRGDRDE